MLTIEKSSRTIENGWMTIDYEVFDYLKMLFDYLSASSELPFLIPRRWSLGCQAVNFDYRVGFRCKGLPSGTKQH